MQNPDHLKLLTKSNFILKELQLLLNEPFPYYVNWAACSAFNGAVLSDRKSTLQILFFSVDSKQSDSGSLIAELSDMKVSVFTRSDSVLQLTQEQLTEAVINSESKYQRIISNYDPDLFHQISCIHLRVGANEALDDGVLKCNQFLAYLSSYFNGTVFPEPVFEEDWISPDIDAVTETNLFGNTERELELKLSAPLPDTDYTRILNSIFPENEMRCFGSGQTTYNSSNNLLKEWDISYLHMFARQF